MALLLSPVLLGLLVLLDQNRFQPWVYQYGAILLLLSTYTWKPAALVEQEKILNVLRLLLAGIYFYSGLQKVNPVFIESVFPWMVQPYMGDYLLIGGVVGFFVPFIEMFIGVGLLFKKTRSLALGGAMVMLILVLLTLGPLGNNWNMVVWPWNIVFASLAILLFWRVDKTFTQILTVPKTVVSFLIVALFGACPVLFFFGKWDGYPSFSLYSGQVATVRITLPPEYEVSDEIKPYLVASIDNKIYFDSNQLSMSDIHVPVYPETRVNYVVAKKICSLLGNDTRVTVEFIPSLHWAKHNKAPKYTCGEL